MEEAFKAVVGAAGSIPQKSNVGAVTWKWGEWQGGQGGNRVSGCHRRTSENSVQKPIDT